MKRVLFFIWATAVFLGLAVLLGDLAFSDDVYNFYWQKGSGPQTVIQSGQPPANALPASDASTVVQTAKPQETATPAATSTTSIAATESAKEEPPAKFGVIAGYTVFNDDAGSGQGVALGFRWMPLSFLGAEAQVLYAPPPTNSSYMVGTSPLRYQLGVVLTPFRMKVFGAELLTFSALAGATTYQSYIDYGSQDIGAYLGAEVGIEIVRNFALLAQAKTVVGNQKSYVTPTQYLAGMTLRF